MKHWLAVCAAVLMSTQAWAAQKYATIEGGEPMVEDDKIEVAELFWYGCPHCYRAEPHIEKWLKTKPADVRFVRVPMLLNNSAIWHTKIYYTAETLGVLDKIHPAMFNAMQNHKLKMTSEDQIAAMFAQVGVSRDQFRSVFNSFEVDSKMRSTQDLASQWAVHSVPTVVVNGKYKTSGSMAGTYPAMMGVVDFLVDQERETRKAKAAMQSAPSAGAVKPAVAPVFRPLN